jgi:hypothetical protein
MKNESKIIAENGIIDNSVNLFENAKKIFLAALELPEYARAEYYAKKQIESGWEKNVFFTTLHEVYHYYISCLEMEQNALKSKTKNTAIKIDDINISLEKETDGRKQGNLNKEVLDDLFDTILIAPKWLAAEPDYSPMQIFSFIERAIRFIRDEFNNQTTLKKIPPTNGKKIFYTIEDFIEAYCFTPSYFIKNSTPFFDFDRFKIEVRNLLLYSIHPENLQKILTPFYDTALKNLTLWNKEIHLLDRDEKYNGKQIIKENQQLKFEIEGLKVWTNLEDFQRFTKYNVERYSNYDFAIFCNKVAGFIGSEVLKKSKAVPEAKQSKNEIETLTDIFSEDRAKILAITEAIKELSITKHCSDRTISGFVDGCKSANALPGIASTHLMKVIYKEISKPIGENIRHHTDQPAYNKSWKATKKYFGIK